MSATAVRARNFSAGPAALPLAVLEQARAELLDYHQSGMSVMEMSHRSPEFGDIAATAEADLRQLLQVPDHYRVLFLQGGASAQFAGVPLNLLGGKQGADYVDTGYWSVRARREAERYGQMRLAASGEAAGFSRIPPADTWQLSETAAYLHLCSNETIGGVQFPDFEARLPALSVPLVADMSSDLLSRPLDVSRFAMIYAGAQKNMGPAGITLVIIREDCLGRAHPHTPSVLDYGVQAKADSMHNTPPTFAWYLVGLVFKRLLAEGGLAAAAARSEAKAQSLYAAIDRSDFYQSPVHPPDRSRMNVPFTLTNSDLDATFLAGAAARGLLNLKGHRSVGGMRASLYNAVSSAAVAELIEYMADFEREWG